MQSAEHDTAATCVVIDTFGQFRSGLYRLDSPRGGRYHCFDDRASRNALVPARVWTGPARVAGGPWSWGLLAVEIS